MLNSSHLTTLSESLEIPDDETDSSQTAHDLPQSSKRNLTGLDGAGDYSDGDSPTKKKKKSPLPNKRPSGKVARREPIYGQRSPAQKNHKKMIELSDDSDDDVPILPRDMKARPNMFSSSRKKTAEAEESSSESEDILPTARKASKSSKGKDTSRASRRTRPIVIEDDDEEDAYVTSSVVQRGKPTTQESDEDSEEPITSPLKRRRPMNLGTHASSSSELEMSPTKRRKRAQATEGEFDDEDSDSDLPSPSKLTSRSKSTPTTPPRYTRQKKEKRRHRSDREKALEIAKRRRAGDKSELTPSESESEGNGDDSNLEHLSDFDDDSESSLVEKRSKSKSKSTGPIQDEDDFIVEDSEGDLGVDISIPLEFTSKNHQKPKEHFRHAIEWMVHKKLNPSFPSTDELYRRAFQVLDNKPSTMASSKFGSSVWTADFYRALNARPVFGERKLFSGEAFDVLGEHKCQACNRRNHPSTFAVRFEGKAYYKDSLDEVEQDDDDPTSSSSSSSESDSQPKQHTRSASLDPNGHALPPESTEWFSGQFCFKKAQTAHMLIHWKHELYLWVLDTLKRDGELKASKVVRRDKMKAKERRDYANAVVDRWALKGGEVDALWRDYDAQIKTAEEVVMGGRWGK